MGYIISIILGFIIGRTSNEKLQEVWTQSKVVLEDIKDLWKKEKTEPEEEKKEE